MTVHGHNRVRLSSHLLWGFLAFRKISHRGHCVVSLYETILLEFKLRLVEMIAKTKVLARFFQKIVSTTLTLKKSH